MNPATAAVPVNRRHDAAVDGVLPSVGSTLLSERMLTGPAVDSATHGQLPGFFIGKVASDLVAAGGNIAVDPRRAE